MANDFVTLAELVQLNDQRLADRDISDLLDDAPILAALAADTVDGTTHKYLKETGAPTVGFREVNKGRDLSKSADTLVEMALKMLDASLRVDKGLAIGYRHGKEAFMGREGGRHLKAAFHAAEKQFIYGSVIDGEGFLGLADALDNQDDAMVIDAGGTTATTGSSVWLIRTVADLDAVAAILGNDGVFEVGEIVEQEVLDPSSKPYTGLTQSILGWLGLQVGGARDIARIANITEDSSKTLTDDMISSALALMPKLPTFMAMSRRSRKQLQQARTATNSTGAPAPFPTEAFGVPIIVSESITDVEVLIEDA